jgi:hypothetical protein
MISLCLQTCPLDMDQAMELTQLICDLEPERRQNTEFFLVYRKDCPLQLPKYFEGIAKPKFGCAIARQARNHEVGWPGGSNMLAFCAMMEINILAGEQLCKNGAFLLFEADCVPLARDWLDQLSREWDSVKAKGKEAFGHWHQQGDATTLHMNGNAVFQADFFERHPTLIVGPATQGWDYWFREQLIALSCDSNLIFQHYNRHRITMEELQAIRKNDVRPALFHGIKTPDGRALVRQWLLS